MSHGSGLGSLFLKYEFTGSSVHVWGGSLEGRLEFTKKTEPRTLDELKSVISNGHRANTPPWAMRGTPASLPATGYGRAHPMVSSSGNSWTVPATSAPHVNGRSGESVSEDEPNVLQLCTSITQSPLRPRGRRDLCVRSFKAFAGEAQRRGRIPLWKQQVVYSWNRVGGWWRPFENPTP